MTTRCAVTSKQREAFYALAALVSVEAELAEAWERYDLIEDAYASGHLSPEALDEVVAARELLGANAAVALDGYRIAADAAGGHKHLTAYLAQLGDDTNPPEGNTAHG